MRRFSAILNKSAIFLLIAIFISFHVTDIRAAGIKDSLKNTRISDDPQNESNETIPAKEVYQVVASYPPDVKNKIDMVKSGLDVNNFGYLSDEGKSRNIKMAEELIKGGVLLPTDFRGILKLLINAKVRLDYPNVKEWWGYDGNEKDNPVGKAGFDYLDKLMNQCQSNSQKYIIYNYIIDQEVTSDTAAPFLFEYTMKVKNSFINDISPDDLQQYRFNMIMILKRISDNPNLRSTNPEFYNYGDKMIQEYLANYKIGPIMGEYFYFSLLYDVIATFYENHQKYDIAIKHLENVVKMTDGKTDDSSKTYHDNAVERIKKLKNFSVELEKIVFLDENKKEIAWGNIQDIHNTSKTYYIQAISKQVSNIDAIKVEYWSDYTNTIPQTIELKKINDKLYESGKLIVDKNLIGKISTSKRSFITFDYVKDAKLSNFNDSSAFYSMVTDLGYINLGVFKGQNSKILSDENINNPVMPTNKDGLKCAGIEYLRLRYQDEYRLIPFKNQANILYYSGHGLSNDGSILSDITSTGDIFMKPEEVSDLWKENLKVVIFAGCSVLNILDGKKPGTHWYDKGPLYFLGYRNKAPIDCQNNDPQSTAKISKLFVNYVKKGIRMPDAWVDANYFNYGYNACSIDTINRVYTYYTYEFNFNKKSHYYIQKRYYKTCVKY